MSIKSTRHKVVGSQPWRVGGVEKVTGSARFTVDVMLPGMLYGKIKRSPHPHARILKIDTSKALALDGVKAVLTVDNVPRVLHAGAPAPRIESLVKDQYILDHKVRFVGDGVAAVAAVREEIADAALDLIEIEYEQLPAVFDPEAAMQSDAPRIHETEGNLVMPPIMIENGNVDQAFKDAHLVLENTYSTGRPVPCYMEPNVCVCQFDQGGNLTVWSSTQNIFMVRGILSEVLDIPVNKIRIIMEHMGGGFGGKQDLYQHEFLCVLLAKMTGRPVKMEYTREECFLGGKTRHPVKIYLKHSVSKDGKLTAREMRYYSNSGAYASHGPGITAVGCYDGTSLFKCDNQRIEGRSIYTNNPVAGAFRGYGAVQAFFALDTQMDELAAALGMDPVDFRMKNVIGEGDLSVSGHRLPSSGLESCLRRGAAEIGWYERHAKQPPEGSQIRRGWGVGVQMHPSGAYPTIKEQSNAIIKMNEDGTVHLLTGVSDLGTGAQSVMAQIAAEALGIAYDDVQVVAGDTDVVPFDIGAYSSRTTFVGGGAVQKAAMDLKSKLLALAAERLGVDSDDLETLNGNIIVKGAAQQVVPIKEIVQGVGGSPVRSLVGEAMYEPEVSHSYAAHFAEVEVDIETGQINVIQVVAVHEIGRAINPAAVEGQIEGGLQQGIGHTLIENLIIDQKTGKALNANFVDYKMPLAMDMPKIKVIILEEEPGMWGPFGAKGIGEDPILAIGQAIANAVSDAVGFRFRDIPITHEKVLEALAGRK